MSATSSFVAGRLLFERDLRLAMRRWDQIADPLVFFVMVTTLFPLALSPELSRLRDVAPGVLWVAALLSSLLAADSLLRSDAQDGTLEQYVLSGQPLTWLLLAKTAAHWMLSGLPLVLISPLVALALGVPAHSTVVQRTTAGTFRLSRKRLATITSPPFRTTALAQRIALSLPDFPAARESTASCPLPARSART